MCRWLVNILAEYEYLLEVPQGDRQPNITMWYHDAADGREPTCSLPVVIKVPGSEDPLVPAPR